jgi:hypothetical protein
MGSRRWRALGVFALAACGCDVVSGLADFGVAGGAGAAAEGGGGGVGTAAGGAGGVGGTGGTGEGGGGGSSPPPRIVGPSDSFMEEGLDLSRWSSSLFGQGITLDVGFGQATFDVALGGGQRYLTVSSVESFSLTSCGVQATLSQATATNGFVAWFAVEAVGVTTRWARFEVVDDELRGRFKQDDQWIPEVAVAYDPVEHLHWRIEEQGGEIVWLVSKDASAWTELGRATPPFTLGEVSLAFGAGAHDDGAFSASYGGINVAP